MTQGKEKHKQNFKERGITLIALVITIIVLLILAGVALSALTGDSGILNNAESAKDKTNLANAKEQVALAAQGALAKGYAQGSGTITRDNLKIELDNIVGVEGEDYTLSEGVSPWTVKVGKYEAIVQANGEIEQEDPMTLPSATGTTPWLPAGFSKVRGTNLDTGLTIANTLNGTPGTQNYVWIEVPTTIEEDITLGDGTTKTVKLANAADEEIALILEAYAGDYSKGSSEPNYISWKDQWYDQVGYTKDDGYRANKYDATGCGMTMNEYEIAYKSMLKSIQKHGGFWLAQYEAGISYEQGNRKSSSPRIEENPASANYAKDQYPYNYVYCSEAQKIANNDSTSSYTSSLPFGIQWDLVCKFLEVKKAKTYEEIATNSRWGNYKNLSWTSSENSKYSIDDYVENFTSGKKVKEATGYAHDLLTTGAIYEVTVDSTKYYTANPMNIYDFAGNVKEWTLEHATGGNGPCVARGGDCRTFAGSEVSPASRRSAEDIDGPYLYWQRRCLWFS